MQSILYRQFRHRVQPALSWLGLDLSPIQSHLNATPPRSPAARVSQGGEVPQGGWQTNHKLPSAADAPSNLPRGLTPGPSRRLLVLPIPRAPCRPRRRDFYCPPRLLRTIVTLPSDRRLDSACSVGRVGLCCILKRDDSHECRLPLTVNCHDRHRILRGHGEFRLTAHSAGRKVALLLSGPRGYEECTVIMRLDGRAATRGWHLAAGTNLEGKSQQAADQHEYGSV